MNYCIRVYKEGPDYGIDVSENGKKILTRIITDVPSINHLVFLFKSTARDKLVRALMTSRYKTPLKEVISNSNYA